MLFSTAASSVTLQPVLSAVSRHLSLKQLNDGAFLIGGGWLGDATPDRRAYTMREASIEASWTTACELLPAVGKQQIARSWCGLEAESLDQIPFIGPAPGLAGLTIVAGFSGHGFALAPAVGRAVADQINGRPAPELDVGGAIQVCDCVAHLHGSSNPASSWFHSPHSLDQLRGGVGSGSSSSGPSDPTSQ